MTSWRALVVYVLALPGSYLAQSASTLSQGSNAEGQTLAAELRATRPVENLDVKGVLKIRNAAGQRTRLPFHYRFINGEKSWQSIYETEGSGREASEKLVVIH